MQCLEDAEKTSVNFQIQRSKKSICPDNNAVLNIDEQVQELIKVRDSLNALLTRLKGNTHGRSIVQLILVELALGVSCSLNEILPTIFIHLMFVFILNLSFCPSSNP